MNQNLHFEILIHVKYHLNSFLRLKDIISNEVLFNVSNPYFDKIKTFILDENIILIINKYFSSIKLELEILDKNKKFLGDRRSFYATLRLIGNV